MRVEWGIDPKTLPDPRSIAETGPTDVYEFCLNDVKSMLKTAPKTIALTLDCWTNNCVKRSFVNYKVHFTSDDFQMKMFALKTEIFPHPHTGLRIAHNILETLKDFGLESKDVFAVSDNGANVVAGIRQANIRRIACSAHNLHLFISNDILKSPLFSVTLATIKKLKMIFKALTYKPDELSRIVEINEQSRFLKLLKSSMQIDELMTSEEMTSPEFDCDDDDLPELQFKSLKNSNATRWGSMLAMIRSFKDNATTVNIALSHVDRTDLLIGLSEKEKKSLNLNLFYQFLKATQRCFKLKNIRRSIYRFFSWNKCFECNLFF